MDHILDVIFPLLVLQALVGFVCVVTIAATGLIVAVEGRRVWQQWGSSSSTMQHTEQSPPLWVFPERFTLEAVRVREPSSETVRFPQT